MYKISTVSGHGCIRMMKMNLALAGKGHKIHLIVGKFGNFKEDFQTYTVASDTEQTIESLKMHSHIVDFFHVHNEPSFYVSMIKEFTDKPVILDVHDSYLARLTQEEVEKHWEKGNVSHRVYTEERNNFQLADALVFPSHSFADVVCSEFGLNQPRLILPSYVPKSMYRWDGREWLGGLVYEGKAVLDDDNEMRINGGFKYCDYRELSKKASELGIDFHLYAARTDKPFLDAHHDALCHKPSDCPTLIKNLTRHDWGLVGNLQPTTEWNVAFPNKLFEYLAAGVPVVALNAPKCEEFILEHGVGIVVKSLEELRERWAEHRVCRANVYKKRQQFSMDANIYRLEEFYKEVLWKHSQKTPKLTGTLNGKSEPRVVA